MKLLIAEDDKTSRIMLQDMVGKWNYDPVLVEDGEQAWDILSGNDPPQLILLDWEMPGPSGLEICRKVRKIDTDKPPFIILLTVRGKTEDIVAGLDAGANEYVTKPFNKAELRARLQVGRRMLDLQTELNEANALLQYQATHDALTGLLNRGAVMDAIERELARSQRQGNQLCVGICDVDNFKDVNDTYGHLAGDAVLQDLADRFNKELRPYDLIGRYGGEEFLIVTDANDGCMALFERMRASVADTEFQYQGVSIPMTISLGVTRTTVDSDVISVLAEADKALYEAKAMGRNRTIFLQDPPDVSQAGQESSMPGATD